MYLFCYYVGSSVLGALSGLVFDRLPWAGFVLVLALALTPVLGVAALLGRRERLGDGTAGETGDQR